jgi:TonB-linked SusC/RagA family outer membrane protein
MQLNYGQTKNWNPSTATMRFASVPPVTNTLYLAGAWESSWLNENTATYNLAIGKHKLDFLAGYTAQKLKSHTISVNAQNFPDDRINDLDAAVTINATATNPAGTDETTNEWSMISYLGRANYSYSGKYNLSAVIRRDGSSRFGENNRWGYFPSFSGSWVLSDEEFFPKNRLISLAKLRASWGLTGNNNIGNYTQYALVSLGQNAIIGNSIVSGARVTNLNNTMLGWEKTGQFNIGFDLGIIKNRIDVGYDYYVKRTTDLLYNFSIPQSSGYASFMGNSGEIKFWGHEISVQSRNLVGKFKWNTNFNITFGDNKVVYLADNVNAIYNGGFGSGHITKVGERVGLFWGMIADGVYDNQTEYDSSPKATQSAVGTIKFKDVNNDGKILNTNTGGDLTVIGDPTPKFMFGMTNTFKYENLDLSITMSGSYGNDINNSFIQGAGNLDGPFNVLKEVKDRWRSPENPGKGKYGTTRYNTGAERDWFSTRFIEDGSYLTIKNITLGYNVNVKRFNYLKSLRVYGSIQQVYTFTKYSGNNPEVSNSTSVLTLGDDMTGYPVPRAWSFGVNVGF